MTCQAVATTASFCQSPDTKYSCVNCEVIICNVSSVLAQEHKLGYSEENYWVYQQKKVNNYKMAYKPNMELNFRRIFCEYEYLPRVTPTPKPI